MQDGKGVHSEKSGLTAEQIEIRCLQKELKEAQLERDILSRCSQGRQVQKGGGHLFQGRGQIFRFINAYREIFSVEKMCKVMKVSVSGYERNVRLSAPLWLKHTVSSRTVKEQELIADIDKIYNSSKKSGPDAQVRGRSMAALEFSVNYENRVCESHVHV